MVQFQGMFAEYEKARLMERYRRGKAYRARPGSVNVLGVPRSATATSARPRIAAPATRSSATRRRSPPSCSAAAPTTAPIADLTRWLTSESVPTRTGKARWDRPVIWGMLRNPAYAGTAVSGKTQVLQEQPGLNRRGRLEGRTTPRAPGTAGRPRKDWIGIPVPAIVSTGTFERAARRLEDNKRYASRNIKVPSLLQGLAACSACGYGYYRTSARTTSKKIYYRCPGSDDCRYQGGRVCGNKPVRADYPGTVVWDHITGLLADLTQNAANRRPLPDRADHPGTLAADSRQAPPATPAWPRSPASPAPPWPQKPAAARQPPAQERPDLAGNAAATTSSWPCSVPASPASPPAPSHASARRPERHRADHPNHRAGLTKNMGTPPVACRPLTRDPEGTIAARGDRR